MATTEAAGDDQIPSPWGKRAGGTKVHLRCRPCEVSSIVTVLAAAILLSCSNAQPTAPHTPTPLVPPPPTRATPCPPTAGQVEFVSRLKQSGVHVTAMAASKMQALVSGSAVACWFMSDEAPFDAFFFPDAASAAFRVCEATSGSRYVYSFNGRTIDAAYRMHWTVQGNIVVDSTDGGLDAKIKTALNGSTPLC